MAFEEQQPFDPASFEHIPVLLNECLTGLAIDPAGTYLDGTTDITRTYPLGELTEDEKAILLDGCLMNYYAARQN